MYKVTGVRRKNSFETPLTAVYSESLIPWRTAGLTRELCRALLLTVDTNVLDHRQSTDKLIGTRSDAEPGIKMGPFTDYPRYHDPKLNWADLTWLKDLAQGTPIYLKGVSHIDVSYYSISTDLSRN